MIDPRPAPLVLHSRHTGERLELTRFEDAQGQWLEINGTLPPKSVGPPLHVHVFEDEGGRVLSGTLSAIVGSRTIVVSPGDQVILPKGQPHCWWNEGDQELVFEGYARPVVDLDRFLQAIFEVVNAGPAGRPPLFYMAHVVHRHRPTQKLSTLPSIVQTVLLPAIVAIGHLLGRYRGADWPGAPGRCQGAPLAKGTNSPGATSRAEKHG